MKIKTNIGTIKRFLAYCKEVKVVNESMYNQLDIAMSEIEDYIKELERLAEIGKMVKMASKKGKMFSFIDNCGQIDYPVLHEWYKTHWMNKLRRNK